jgi:PAS domain S-box-containing protein
MTAPLPGSLLAEIIGISSDAVICIGSDYRIIFFNEGAARIFGYEADEVMGQPLDVLLPLAARAGHQRHIDQFVGSPITARRMGERQEISGRRKSGEEFPAEAAIAKLRSGNELFASVVLRDVTERKRAERRQRLVAEVSEQLASSLELGDTLGLLARLWIPSVADLTVVEMTHRGALNHVRAMRNPQNGIEQSDIVVVPGVPWEFVDGLEHSPAQPVSMVSVEAALDVIPACYREDLARVNPCMAFSIALSTSGEAFGRIIAFNSRKTSLVSGDLALVHDLARRASMALENARLHDEIRWALRARDDTMSVVSHDLRNPVNAVKMLAGAVLRAGPSEPLPPTVAEQVRVIQSAAQQMDTLIQDLLDMSRAEVGRFAVDTRSVHSGALLRDALRTLGPLAEDKGVTIATAWADSLPDVQVDPERITQVISNIVGNAIKFTPAGGEIRVSADELPDAVVVRVSDTGPGIPVEHLVHVFDRYWQLTRRHRGAGLGLPIAKAIIEAHAGRIWVESSEGKGATFHFTLPRE